MRIWAQCLFSDTSRLLAPQMRHLLGQTLRRALRNLHEKHPSATGHVAWAQASLLPLLARMKGSIDPFSEPQRESGKTSHHLLGGWRDIFDDIRKLADAVDKLPEHCACGHGGAHLRGACACCMEGTAARGCVDCEALLRQIADRIEALRADDLRFMVVLRDFADHRPDRGEMRQGIDDVANRASRLVRIVEGVQVAAADFREGCRTDHLARLKAGVRELRDEARRLDKQW